MIIFGTKSTRKLLDRGDFDCPQCGQTTPYEKRRARTWFHLYFIPLIPTGTYPPYVECRSCKATFVEGVLDHTSAENKGAVRAEFETGMLAILARMALADGVVETSEIEAIHEIVNKLAAREFSWQDVTDEIAAARESLDDALSVSTRVGKLLNDEGREVILNAVFHIAIADGDFAAEEQEMLLEIGAGLGLRPAHVRGLIAEFMDDVRRANEEAE